MKLTPCYRKFAVYSNENYYLTKYLKRKDIDLPRYIQEFMSLPETWRHDLLGRSHVDPGEFEEAIKNGGDSFYMMCSRIENHMTPKDKRRFNQSLLRQKRLMPPSWALMGIVRERLPRQTWLIHFSDQAENVSQTGFQRGIDDMKDLALTTWIKEESKKYGGYNFAFIAGDPYSREAAEDGDYGDQAVMFQASGVEVHHKGDQQNQVIFWGKAIDSRTMVYLNRDGLEWTVAPRPSSSMSQRGRNYAFKGDFGSVVNWVKQNWFQYRRQIMGNFANRSLGGRRGCN